MRQKNSIHTSIVLVAFGVLLAVAMVGSGQNAFCATLDLSVHAFVYPDNSGNSPADAPNTFQGEDDIARRHLLWPSTGSNATVTAGDVAVFLDVVTSEATATMPEGKVIIKGLTFTFDGLGSYTCPDFELKEDGGLEGIPELTAFWTKALNMLKEHEKVAYTISGYTNKKPKKHMGKATLPSIYLRVEIRDLSM